MSVKKELAKGSAAVSSITLLGHLLSTTLKLLVSRNFGLLGFGQYALIMACSRFISTVVHMGYSQSIVHFVSKFRTRQDWHNAKHFFVSGIMHILLAAFLMSIALILVRDSIFNYIDLGNSAVFAIFLISAISTILAINNYISGALRGLKLFKEQAILFTSSFPFLMISSLLLLKWFHVESPGIFQFLSMGILLNLIILIGAFFFTRKNLSIAMDASTEKEDIKQLPKYSRPIWLSSILQSGFRSSDRIMLGLFSSISQVGLYGAGLTFSILFAFPLKAMGPVFQPYIIERYSDSDFEGLNKLYNTMVRWSALFVIPAFSALLCFGDHIVSIFGKDFTSAYSVMIILSIAQIISTVSGIAGTILNMTEKQNQHARIMTTGFIMAIILNLLLIPKYGALGAAIGTGISIVAINVFRVRNIIKYYALKPDYAIVFWLILKFTPLVILCFWLIQQAVVHWLILLAGFMLLSISIVYSSLSQNEKKYLITSMRNVF